VNKNNKLNFFGKRRAIQIQVGCEKYFNAGMEKLHSCNYLELKMSLFN
jgi:hypothetical protein